MMVEETELAASAWMRWVLKIPTVIAFRLVLESQYLVLLRTRTRMCVQIQREEEKLFGSLHWTRISRGL